MTTAEWNIIRIWQEVIGEKEMCLKWCEEQGLLPVSRVCAEGHKMIPNAGKSCYGQFRCFKKHANGKPETFSRSRATFFENKRMSPERIIIIMFCFVKDMSYSDCIVESSIDNTTSKETVAEIYGLCRELITQYLLDLLNHSSQIGGKDIVVEIDELVLGDRKFHSGPVGKGTYILAIIERETKKFVLETSPDRWNDTDLLKLVKKHVVKESVIIPENWRDCYSSLSEDGYVVKISNENPAYYDSLEAFDCPSVKKILKINMHKELNTDKLLEYLYKEDVKRRNVDPFEALLDVIRHRFPV